MVLKNSKFFSLFLIIFSINIYLLWILTSYFQIDVFPMLSGPSSDLPGNIKLDSPLLGIHYFGDFVLPYFWSQQSSYWINLIEPPNTYPPISMVIFGLFSIYKLSNAIVLYQITLFISILTPAIDLYFKKSARAGAQFTVITLLSIGTISTFDRGNIIGLLVAPLYFFLKIKNEFIKTLIFYILVGIKLYPLLFLIIELKYKKIKNYVVGLFGFIVINIIIMSFQNFSIQENLLAFIKPFKYYSLNNYLSNNLSFRAFIENFTNFIFPSKNNFDSEFIRIFFDKYNLFFSITIFIIFVLFLFLNTDEQKEIKYIFGIFTIWSIVPISFIYVTILMIPVLANLFLKDFYFQKNLHLGYSSQDLLLYKMLYLNLIFTMIPIVIPYQETNLKYMIMNLFWTLLILSFVFRGIKRKFIDKTITNL